MKGYKIGNPPKCFETYINFKRLGSFFYFYGAWKFLPDTFTVYKKYDADMVY